MKKLFLILFFCFYLSGCANTVGGFGTDLENGGIAIQNGVSDIQQSLNL